MRTLDRHESEMSFPREKKRTTHDGQTANNKSAVEANGQVALAGAKRARQAEEGQQRGRASDKSNKAQRNKIRQSINSRNKYIREDRNTITYLPAVCQKGTQNIFACLFHGSAFRAAKGFAMLLPRWGTGSGSRLFPPLRAGLSGLSGAIRRTRPIERAERRRESAERSGDGKCAPACARTPRL